MNRANESKNESLKREFPLFIFKIHMYNDDEIEKHKEIYCPYC